jgi:predicted RecA/RadA family phage recombinase
MTGFMTVSRRLTVVLIFPFAAFAADPALLQMVLPDSQVVAGLQVTQAKGSPFGQYVLAHLSLNDTRLQEFTSQTGFDPTQDVTQIVLASNWKANTPGNHWLVLADGTFNVPKITAAAQANGTVPSVYQGVNLLTHAASSNTQVATAFAFLSPTTALAGDITSVETAIDRKQTNAPTDSNVFNKAQQVSANNDFWFVTLVPLSNFAGAIPDSNLSSAMQGNLFGAVNQASGGISFGDTVTISAEAVMRSDKDAQALVDVVKFLAGLVQMNKQNNPAAGQVATLLDTLQTSVTGNTTTISLSIPEQQIEQLLNSAHQASRGHIAARRVN